MKQLIVMLTVTALAWLAGAQPVAAAEEAPCKAEYVHVDLASRNVNWHAFCDKGPATINVDIRMQLSDGERFATIVSKSLAKGNRWPEHFQLTGTNLPATYISVWVIASVPISGQVPTYKHYRIGDAADGAES